MYSVDEIGPIILLPAGPAMASFHQAPDPPLAEGVVRFAHESVAAWLRDMPGLPAIFDAISTLAPGAPPLHPGWTDNRCAVGRPRGGDIALPAPPLRKGRRVSLGRRSASAMEPRAVLAVPDRRSGGLVLHLSSQRPHGLRHAPACTLGVPETRLGAIARDVGGGLGA